MKDKEKERLNVGDVLTVLLGKICWLCKTKFTQARLSLSSVSVACDSSFRTNH